MTLRVDFLEGWTYCGRKRTPPSLPIAGSTIRTKSYMGQSGTLKIDYASGDGFGFLLVFGATFQAMKRQTLL